VRDQRVAGRGAKAPLEAAFGNSRSLDGAGDGAVGAEVRLEPLLGAAQGGGRDGGRRKSARALTFRLHVTIE